MRESVTFEISADLLAALKLGAEDLSRSIRLIAAIAHFQDKKRIEQLALLQRVVGELVIPIAVAQEITAYQPSQSGSVELNKLPWVQV